MITLWQYLGPASWRKGYLWCWCNWHKWTELSTVTGGATQSRQRSSQCAEDRRWSHQSSGQNSQQESHSDWLASQDKGSIFQVHTVSLLLIPHICRISFLFLCIHDDHPYEILLQIFCWKGGMVVWHMLNHSAKMWIKFSKIYQWVSNCMFRTMPDGMRKAKNL